MRDQLVEMRDLGNLNIEHIHEIQHDLPEECITVMNNDIPLSMQFMYALHMDPDFLFTLNPLNAYEFHKKILQILSYQVGDITTPRRWVLKAPFHLFFIKSIVEVYPDAQFIWYVFMSP